MKRFGNQSKKIARWLRELSDLDLNSRSHTPETGNRAIAQRINVLRGLIPTSMLRHYDHLKSRGKRSVAPVTRGVCGNCHLAFPSGVLADLRRTSETLNLCINCGAFVYFAEEDFANGSKEAVRERRKKVQSNRGVTRSARRKRSQRGRST
jgi:predicted  nucleic acid-binding Zn-ribbon protein